MQRYQDNSSTQSVSTQTESIQLNSLRNVPQTRQFNGPTSLMRQHTWPGARGEHSMDSQDTRHKASQTQKFGLKRFLSYAQMDILKITMIKRRKLCAITDKIRLKKLMKEINADPPPPWEVATLMWLDVDILEKRIEEYEKEEQAEKYEIRCLTGETLEERYGEI